MTTEQSENLLDAPTLLAACGRDPLLLRKMIDSFESRAPAHLADIGEAARRGDVAEIRRSAHKLRGLISTFSTSVAARVGLLERIEADEQPEATLERCEDVAQLVGALSKSLARLTIDDLSRLGSSTNLPK
jgi:HPt (histidine-containing phosphotransfer) domain-containing protein